jgi:hypothetical protein
MSEKTTLTRDQLVEVLESKKWTFAKTMPHNPHYWSQRRDWNSYQEFENAVLAIREYGVKQVYWRREYVCFFAGDFKYWDMGDPLKKVTIINRKNLIENPD